MLFFLKKRIVGNSAVYSILGKIYRFLINFCRLIKIMLFCFFYLFGIFRKFNFSLCGGFFVIHFCTKYYKQRFPYNLLTTNPYIPHLVIPDNNEMCFILLAYAADRIKAVSNFKDHFVKYSFKATRYIFVNHVQSDDVLESQGIDIEHYASVLKFENDELSVIWKFHKEQGLMMMGENKNPTALDTALVKFGDNINAKYGIIHNILT